MNTEAKRRWENDIAKYDLPHLRLRQIAELVKMYNPSSYADLGCGKGTLGALTPGIRYTGCDFALHGESSFDFCYCDFNNEPLPGKIKGVPLITCSGLLEYIEDLDSFLVKINDCLAQKGVLIASYFNMNHISRLFQIIKGHSFQVHPDWRGFHSPKDFKKKLLRNGFSVEKIVPVSHGFTSSLPVRKTISRKTKLPIHNFYSSMLAHQLIFICKKA